jgi:hypothetical protein
MYTINLLFKVTSKKFSNYIFSKVRLKKRTGFDVCTVYLAQFIIQTKKLYIYIYIYIYMCVYIYRKYTCMFQYICIIFREIYLTKFYIL